MAGTSPTRRRWFQFGLRELFWLTLAMALVAIIFVQRRELAKIHYEYLAVQRALGATAVDRDRYRMDAIKANWRAAQLQILHDRTERELARSNSDEPKSAQGELPTELPISDASETESVPQVAPIHAP